MLLPATLFDGEGAINIPSLGLMEEPPVKSKRSQPLFFVQLLPAALHAGKNIPTSKSQVNAHLVHQSLTGVQ